ncbi:MAG: AAA family ATPase [Sulfurimonas sp.]
MHSNLTSHQQEVFQAIVHDIYSNLSSPFKGDIDTHFLSLTGAAGVGKSYLTGEIVQAVIRGIVGYGHNDNGVCITAPTHKALKVIKTMLESLSIKADYRTIQSFLGIKPTYNYSTGEEKYVIDRTKKSLPSVSLLIVDESSMVSDELFIFIKDAFLRGRVNTVLFIGDRYQLLPVNSSSNPVFELKRQYSLTEVVRQAKDSNIISLATLFRERIISGEFIPILELLQDTIANHTEDIEFFSSKEKFVQDFYKNKQWESEDKIITTFANEDVETFNKLVRDRHWNERGVEEPPLFLPNDRIRFKSPYDRQKSRVISNGSIFANGEEVAIRAAKVIINPNSHIKYWELEVYGRSEEDFIRVIDPQSQNDFNKMLNGFIDVAKTSSYENRKSYWKMYFDTKSQFADIQYIYASTIHKLQGSTYDTAYIDLSNIANNQNISNDFKYRLSYVAITRAKNSIKILL